MSTDNRTRVVEVNGATSSDRHYCYDARHRLVLGRQPAARPARLRPRPTTWPTTGLDLTVMGGERTGRVASSATPRSAGPATASVRPSRSTHGLCETSRSVQESTGKGPATTLAEQRIVAISARSGGQQASKTDGVLMLRPRTLIVPDVGRSKPEIRFRRVVLPEPDGPVTATASARSTERSTPSIARMTVVPVA